MGSTAEKTRHLDAFLMGEIIASTCPARLQLGREHRSPIACAAGSEHFHAFSLLNLVIDRWFWRWNAAATVSPPWRGLEVKTLPGQALRANKEVFK